MRVEVEPGVGRFVAPFVRALAVLRRFIQGD
jgi:hypothetical protein